MEQLLVGMGICASALLICNLIWIRSLQRDLSQRDCALDELRSSREVELRSLKEAVSSHEKTAADARMRLLETRNKLRVARGDLARARGEGGVEVPLHRARVEVRGGGGRGWAAPMSRLRPLAPELMDWSEPDEMKTEIVRFQPDGPDDSARPM